jgi:ferredoxin
LVSRKVVTPLAAIPAKSQPEMTEESLPETGSKPTTVTFARSGKMVTLSPDMSILEAGESVGLDLPYECRSGFCGQCKMRLIAGSVAMEIEDAITAAEKNAGWVLGCQAIALGDVTVDA